MDGSATPNVGSDACVLDRRAPRDAGSRAADFYRSILKNSPDVVAVVDDEGRVQYSSPAAEQLLGVDPDQRRGRSLFELVHPEDVSAQRAWLRQLLDSPGAVVEAEYRIVRPDGGVRFLHGRGRNCLHDPAVRGLVLHLRVGRVVGGLSVSSDVIERERQAEAARFRAQLLEAVGQAVIATDPEGTVTFWNQAAEGLYGWTESEALGRPVEELTVPEAGIEEAEEIMGELREGRRWSGEYVVRAKDGSTFPAYVTNTPVVEGGELTGIIGVSSDLREQKALEAQLLQAQKMEAVGRLAGGVAHDFNNLLTAIGGYAGMAAERADDPQLASDIAEVVDATQRARSLVNKLLTFSRRSEAAVQAVDLDSAVTGVVAMLRRMIGADIRLETALASGGWRVAADPVQLEQAVVNLAVNARDAMPQGGTLSIRTNRVTLDQERVAHLAGDPRPGEYVRLVVEDTGTGIEAAVLEHMFEPFFTTKEVGKGTGLGLSTVFGAISSAGGGIGVESRPGEGTRFSLYLPAGSAATPVEHRDGEDPTHPVAARPKTARILLVEDEAAVRSLARRVLEREGYEVLEADTGVEAERVLEDAAAPLDLLLTDVIMPEMGGAELAERVREVEPEVRVLYMSGYTADELRSRGIDEGRSSLLMKPFTPKQLASAVRKVLSR